MITKTLKNLTTLGLEREKDLKYAIGMKEKLSKNNKFFKEYRQKLLPLFNNNELLFHVFDDNPFLKYCHRNMPINNYFTSFLTIFKPHNETLNILSHLFAFSYFCKFLLQLILLPSSHFTPNFKNSSAQNDNDPFLLTKSSSTPSTFSQTYPTIWRLIDFPKLKLDLEISLACFCITWLFSTLYHTFKANSLKDYKRFLILDLCGIIFSISGANHIIISTILSFTAPISAKFFITLNWCFCIAMLLVIPYLVEYRMTKIRTISFILFMASSSIISFGLGFFYLMVKVKIDAIYNINKEGNNEMLNCWTKLCLNVFLNCLLPNWFFEIVGLIVKDLKYPEKFFFNSCCFPEDEKKPISEEERISNEKNYFAVCLTSHSHLIFHILSTIGCYVFYSGFLGILNKDL